MRHFVVIAVLSAVASALPWPVDPQASIHRIGTSYGNYEYFGRQHHLHDGVDIMVPEKTAVRAIKPGFVKKVLKSNVAFQCGVVVADSAGAAFCSGYLYFHLVGTSIRVNEGDTVAAGDVLGNVVHWDSAGFHHLHFSAVRDTGVTWSAYGDCYRNPLLDLSPDNDSTAPTFLDACHGQRFAICLDNTSTYQSKDNVYGLVDLICRLDERINDPVWRVAVYRIDYSIRDTLGNYVVPLTRGVEMSDSITLTSEAQARVVYKQDGTCGSCRDYDATTQQYFYIFTNTDGDSLIEPSDSLGCWNTMHSPDGDYWVKVIARDKHGNTAADSMKVKVRNSPDVGVTSITSPPDTVRMGSVVTPACTLCNYGNRSESYSVRMFIAKDYQQASGSYDTVVTVVDHAPGTKRAQVFPDWTVTYLPGSYVVSCSTQLGTDTLSANDRARGSVEVTGIRNAWLSPPASPPLGAWPNPARRQVCFRVTNDTDVATLKLSIFDAAGRWVRTLRAVQSGGSSTLVWDGCDARGRMLPGGVYLCRVGRQRDVIRVVLLR